MKNHVHDRIERVLGQFLRWGISGFFLIVVAGSCLAAFMHFQSKLESGTLDVTSYWPQSLIPLAILVAFSGLLYNRARAVGAGATKQRFRSLYAAERLLAAACFYVAGLVTVLFAALTADFFVQLFRVPHHAVFEFKMSLYALSVPLLGWSIAEASHTLSLMAPNGAYRRTVRVARRVRKLL